MAGIEKDNRAFAFNHGFGLGVIRKPGGTDKLGPLLNLLFESDSEAQAKLRKFYVHIGRYLDALRKVRGLAQRQQRVQIKDLHAKES